MLILLLAPVAQLDRAVDYGSAGCVFDSRRAHANFTQIYDLVVKFSIPHLPLEMVERDYLGNGFTQIYDLVVKFSIPLTLTLSHQGRGNE